MQSWVIRIKKRLNELKQLILSIFIIFQHFFKETCFSLYSRFSSLTKNKPKNCFLSILFLFRKNRRKIKVGLISVPVSLSIIVCGFVLTTRTNNFIAKSEGTIKIYNSKANYTDNDKVNILPCGYSFNEQSNTYYVNSNAVGLRSSPDDSSEIIMTCDYASEITVLGEDIGKSFGWSKVNVDNKVAYIPTEYLSTEMLFIEETNNLYVCNETYLKPLPNSNCSNGILVQQNTELQQVAYNNNWIKVVYGGYYYYIERSYLSEDMIFFEKETSVYVHGNSFLKSAPVESADYNIFSVEDKTELQQIGYNTDWIKVKYNGNIYYILRSFTTPYLSTYNSSSNTYEIYYDGENYSGDKAIVLQTAYSFLGQSYVWGSATPTAMDCSGLTKQCFAEVGYDLYHKASEQVYAGVEVPAGEALQPCDLLLFSSSNGWGITHAAIYVGDGMMIHAANSTSGVIASDLSQYCQYGGRLVYVRRLVE